jgi:hypothetical protein
VFDDAGEGTVMGTAVDDGWRRGVGGGKEWEQQKIHTKGNEGNEADLKTRTGGHRDNGDPKSRTEGSKGSKDTEGKTGDHGGNGGPEISTEGSKGLDAPKGRIRCLCDLLFKAMMSRGVCVHDFNSICGDECEEIAEFG